MKRMGERKREMAYEDDGGKWRRERKRIKA